MSRPTFDAPITRPAASLRVRLLPTCRWLCRLSASGRFRNGRSARLALVAQAIPLLRPDDRVDARAHGESGGDMATYGWKERHDTVAVVNALCSTEKSRHLYALGVSMGAAVALQSAAIEPRIAAVVAEDAYSGAS